MRVKAIQAETCLLIKMIQESGPILQGEVGAEQQAEGQAGYKHTGLGTVLSHRTACADITELHPMLKKQAENCLTLQVQAAEMSELPQLCSKS